MFAKFVPEDVNEQRLQNILVMLRTAATENAKVGISETVATIFVRCEVARRLVTFSGLFPHFRWTAATFLAGSPNRCDRAVPFYKFQNPTVFLPVSYT